MCQKWHYIGACEGPTLDSSKAVGSKWVYKAIITKSANIILGVILGQSSEIQKVGKCRAVGLTTVLVKMLGAVIGDIWQGITNNSWQSKLTWFPQRVPIT